MKRPNKYRAKPVTVDGIRFASSKEARRYGELKVLERAGKIRQLVLQPKFKLTVNGHLICEYWGDFAYFEKARVIEDTKGFKTEVYKLKRKLLLALYPGIDHREI